MRGDPVGPRERRLTGTVVTRYPGRIGQDADHIDALDFSLDRESELPLGTQLAWKLRSMIATGRLSAGDRLPGARQLASAANVNVNTIRTVYSRLEASGVIDVHHGRGTFVAATASQDATLRGLAESAASDARRAGLDPRELAATLYFQASPATTELAEPAGSIAIDERASRARLRRQIAALEAALGPERKPVTELRVDAGSIRGGRLLSAAQLEQVRDDLLERLLENRTAEARHAQAADSREDRQGSEAEGSERTAPSRRSGTRAGGPWSLRWDAGGGRLVWSVPYVR